jgi:hypothetical protein
MSKRTTRKNYHVMQNTDFDSKQDLAVIIILVNEIVDEGAKRFNIDSPELIKVVKNGLITDITTKRLSREGGSISGGGIQDIINSAMATGCFLADGVQSAFGAAEFASRWKTRVNAVCSQNLAEADKDVLIIDSIFEMLDLPVHYEGVSQCFEGPAAMHLVGPEALVVHLVAKSLWFTLKSPYPFLREFIAHKIQRRGKRGLQLQIINENYEMTKEDRWYKLREDIINKLEWATALPLKLAPKVLKNAVQLKLASEHREDPKQRRARLYLESQKIGKDRGEKVNKQESNNEATSNNEHSGGVRNRRTQRSPYRREEADKIDLMIIICSAVIHSAAKMKGWNDIMANIARLSTYSYLRVYQQNKLIEREIDLRNNITNNNHLLKINNKLFHGVVGNNVHGAIVKTVLGSIVKGNTPEEVVKDAEKAVDDTFEEKENAKIIANSFSDTYSKLIY